MAHVPYHELVVVATRGKHLLVMRAPAQPTDLLLVPAQVLDETRLGAHVSHQYLLVFGATGDERARPGAGADSVLVPAHTADHLLLLNVPDLHMTVICAHG